MRAVRLRDVRARPPSWLVDGLIPQGHITLLFGRGGVGKTYLWLVIASHLAAGVPLFGRNVMQGKTLILDAELSEESAAHRAEQVARGMELPETPDGLIYARLNGSIFEANVASEIRQLVKEHAPLLVVVDALSSAAPESDPTEAVAARKVLTDLLSLGTTVLAIDHVSKAAISRGGSSPMPLGSVAKENIMRSGLFVERRMDGTVRLYQTKNTFGECAQPIALRVTVEPNLYRIEPIEQARREQVDNRRTRILTLLSDHPGGLATDAIAGHLGTSKKSALNRLGELSRDGLIVRTDEGAWTLLTVAQ